MRAIVAPKLASFSYSPPSLGCSEMEADMFNTSTPQYPSVTDLVFLEVAFVECSEALSFSFPAVHHLVLDSNGVV